MQPVTAGGEVQLFLGHEAKTVHHCEGRSVREQSEGYGRQ